MIEFNSSPNAAGYQTAAINLEVIAASGLVVEGSRWCAWRADWKGRDPSSGKPAKIPCASSGSPLSVSKPEKWLAFDEARGVYGTGRFDGVGLLMSSYAEHRGGLVGLDLDRCLNPDGSVVAEAADVVAGFLALGAISSSAPAAAGCANSCKGFAWKASRKNARYMGCSI